MLIIQQKCWLSPDEPGRPDVDKPGQPDINEPGRPSRDNREWKFVKCFYGYKNFKSN
jgi:hypothetical protein